MRSIILVFVTRMALASLSTKLRRSSGTSARLRREMRKRRMNLGFCYENGSGVAVDKAEAVKWYKRAAEAGDANAQIALTKF